MAEIKYGHLIKKLNFEEGKAKNKDTGNADYLAWPKGSDLEGIKMNYAFGYCSKAGAWFPEEKTGHTHTANECLAFVSLDYDNPNYLGAELEITLGEEGEKHVFNSPSVVTLPTGLPHCPLITKKAEKNYGFFLICLDSDYKTTQMPEKAVSSETTEKKYGNLIKTLNLRKLERPWGGNADIMSGMNAKTLEGFNLNFTWAFHSGLGAWHGDRDPHVHPAAEILVFVGLDPKRPDYLGAELEIAMGEEQEIHVINTPTIVAVPAGLVHCPLVTKRVDKPYGFSAISLNGGHETTWLGEGAGKPSGQ
jgi:hypothetical protein